MRIAAQTALQQAGSNSIQEECDSASSPTQYTPCPKKRCGPRVVAAFAVAFGFNFQFSVEQDDAALRRRVQVAKSGEKKQEKKVEEEREGEGWEDAEKIQASCKLFSWHGGVATTTLQVCARRGVGYVEI